MKRISYFLLSLALTAGAAQAQSYVIKANGVVLNIDNAGELHDRGQFILPFQIRYSGGQFYVNKDRQLVTTDDGGYFYRQDVHSMEAPKSVAYTGFNYFIEENGTPWTIDRQGVPFKGEKNKALKKPLMKGGNFIIVPGERRQPPRLFVITDRGNLLESVVDGLDLTTIKHVGGNWMVTADGALYTISREGFVYSKRDLIRRILVPEVRGGNFVVSGGKLIVIADDGVVSEHGELGSYGAIVKTGHNYFVTQDGKLIVINSQGEVHDRTGNHDFKNIALSSF